MLILLPLTENINPIKGLANGTQVYLHSLTWPSTAPVQSYLGRIACAVPGEEVYVDIAPIREIYYASSRNSYTTVKGLSFFFHALGGRGIPPRQKEVHNGYLLLF